MCSFLFASLLAGKRVRALRVVHAAASRACGVTTCLWAVSAAHAQLLIVSLLAGEVGACCRSRNWPGAVMFVAC